MIISAATIFVLALAMKVTGKPWIYALIYYLIILVLGMMNGNLLTDQLIKALIFSVFPAISFFLMNWKKDSVIAWILIIGAAVVANDLMIWGFEEIAAR